MISELEIIYFINTLPKVSFSKTKFKTHYKVSGRMLLIVNSEHLRICVRLSNVEQEIFENINSKLIHKVPNHYGKMGWTLIYYSTLDFEIVKEIITSSYCYTANQKLALLVRNEDELLPYHATTDIANRRKEKF
jgi:hypothetical protein